MNALQSGAGAHAAPDLLPPIDFYFDFSSPYAYLGSELIDAIGQKYGRKVHWHAVLIGAAFKVTGNLPLVQQPVKGLYALGDIARSARFHDIPYAQPPRFPLGTVHAARAFRWLTTRDPMVARGFAHATFRAYFTAGRDIDTPETVLDIAHSIGIPRQDLAEALSGTQLKEHLRTDVDRAVARGVFGTPFFIVEGESFWGVDRLPQLERWLSEGGF